MPASGHDPRLEYSASNESLPASAPSATIFFGYCTVSSGKEFRGRLGLMSLIEIRTYTIHEGKREEFVKRFDEVLLPAQRQVGLEVLGQFIPLDDDQTFVWLRRFDSQEARWRRWDEFYGSDLWETGSAHAPTR
jgi:NIPSNAP